MASKKPSTNKKYYWFLLLPLAAIVVLAILLIPRSKHHDWDDDEDEEDNPTEIARHGRTPILDEDLRNIPEASEPEWGGNSPAFSKEVAPGIVISASKNAFEQPTDVKFRFATEEEDKMAGKAVEQRMELHAPLFTFSLDAGLEPTQRIPGTFNVAMDLEQLEIPEDLWDGLRVCRIDDYGNVQEWNSRVEDGKFCFDTDRNCLWVVTCVAVAAALTAKLGSAAALTSGLVLASSLAPQGFSNLALRSGFGGKKIVYDHFSVARYGWVKIGFLPEHTEHHNPDKYLKMVTDAEERMKKLKEEAEDEVWQATAYERTLRDDNNPIPIYHDTQSRFSFATKYESKIRNDDELINLISTIQKEVPQSIRDIEEMIQWAVVYLKDVQGLKVPGSMCGLYFGDNDIVDGKMQANAAYHHYLDMDPWIGFWYYGKYVTQEDGPYVRENGVLRRINRIDATEKDKLRMTICHELFHHFQGSYVVSSLFKDMRLAESTAAVLEHDYTDWLYKVGKLDYDPRTREGGAILEFVDRAPKEWLFGSLCEPITPSSVKFDQVGELFKSTFTMLVRLKMQENAHQPFMDSNYMTQADRDAKEAIDEFSHRAKLTWDQLLDIFGFLGEHFGGPNCDVGYMLGDFIDYLRRHRMPSNKLHYILEYGSGWNLAKALKQGFLIETDAEFYGFYEGFIKQYLKDIVQRQDYFVSRDTFDIFYRGQLSAPVEVDPVNCVQKLTCWAHPGPYACRTVKISSKREEDRYNLLLVPSLEMRGDGEKAIKAVIIKEDSLFAPTPYYLEADSNGNRSPAHVALLFTNVFDGYLAQRSVFNSDLAMLKETNDYYDAVAYFAPRKKPTVNPVTDGSYQFQFDERPVEALKKKKYVTGVEFKLMDSSTGQTVDSVKVVLPANEREPITATLYNRNRSAGEEADLTGHVRWYYQPDPNDTTCYYSPWSEKGDEETGLIVNTFSYITTPGVGSSFPFNPSTNPKARLKVWTDGRFEFKVPGSNSCPAFQASGLGKIGEGLSVFPASFDDFVGKIDPQSFTSTPITVTEQERNAEGEYVNVSVEYKIMSPEGGYVLYERSTNPSVPTDVQVSFQATRKSPISGTRETSITFIGQDKAVNRRSSNPFSNEPID